jgi:rieske iron-sulfur protein
MSALAPACALAAWSDDQVDSVGPIKISASGRERQTVSDYGHQRRTVLKGALALGVGLPLLEAQAATQDDPKKLRPQVGDVLVFDRGDRKDQPVQVADVPDGGPVVGAYAMEPASGVVRRGSKLNRIVLVRLDPASYSDETLPYTADGVVAYSGFCTHQGCPLKDWDESAEVILCACHDSKFDPRERGRVVFGPAKRRLAILPIERRDDALVVAAAFVGEVGVAKG